MPKAIPAYNLHDFRDLAKKRLPKGIFEYIDRGVEDEVALAENRAAFNRIKLRPRVLVDVTGRSAATELFGQPMAMPVAVAPKRLALVRVQTLSVLRQLAWVRLS